MEGEIRNKIYEYISVKTTGSKVPIYLMIPVISIFIRKGE